MIWITFVRGSPSQRGDFQGLRFRVEYTTEESNGIGMQFGDYRSAWIHALAVHAHYGGHIRNEVPAHLREGVTAHPDLIEATKGQRVRPRGRRINAVTK